MPLVQRLSLMPMGMPSNSPMVSLAAIFASTRSAAAIALSAVTQRKLWSLGSSVSIRCRVSVVISTAERAFETNC